MKIGVISDTHSRELPQQVMEDLQDVDFIIHAGDLCDMETYQQISHWKELKAVHGNMDEVNIKDALPGRLILECEGYRIGIYHGQGPEHSLLEKVKKEFQQDDVDAVIFGHSHHPHNERIGNTLFFNPGSPNDKIFAPYCSYGILEVNEEGVKGTIIKVRE